MKCPTCGKDNPEHSRFCGICGTSLGVSTASAVMTTASEVRVIKFTQAIKLGFQNYFTFNGRATRGEYWWWALFVVLAGIGLAVIDSLTGTMGMFGDSGLLGGLFELVVLIPSFALGTRRLHDINRTGWWLLLIFGFFPIAAIGAGILLISLFLMDNFLVLTVMGLVIAIGFGILGVIGIVVLIVWAIKQGDEGSNKYGPDPRHTIAEQISA